MSTHISQKEDLIALDKKELIERIVTLETFIWNLAQKYFAQDDFSRRETAREKNRSPDLSVNGREAFEHWLAAKGPEYFSNHFKDINAIMRAFRCDGVGEKPPPPD